MNNQQIIDLYDTDLEITISEIAKISGREVSELKKILNGSKGRKIRCDMTRQLQVDNFYAKRRTGEY